MTIKYYVDGAGVYLGGFDGTPPEGGIEVSDPPGHAQQVWDGEAWGPLPPDETPTPSSPGIRPTLWAVAYGVSVSGGDIGGISAASAISAALYMDVGTYWIFLAENVDPSLYFPKVTDDATKMKVLPENKFEDYFVITATDANGDPVDPENFDIEIVRLV